MEFRGHAWLMKEDISRVVIAYPYATCYKTQLRVATIIGKSEFCVLFGREEFSKLDTTPRPIELSFHVVE